MDLVGYSAAENMMYAIVGVPSTLLMAIVLSQMVVLVQRRQALTTANLQRRERTRQAMDSLRLPATLKLRILSYMSYEQARQMHR